MFLIGKVRVKKLEEKSGKLKDLPEETLHFDHLYSQVEKRMYEYYDGMEFSMEGINRANVTELIVNLAAEDTDDLEFLDTFFKCVVKISDLETNKDLRLNIAVGIEGKGTDGVEDQALVNSLIKRTYGLALVDVVQVNKMKAFEFIAEDFSHVNFIGNE